MFKYRVLSNRMGGNAIRLYTVLDKETNETFEVRGRFFHEKGDAAFENVRVIEYEKGYNFNILKKNKVE